MKSNGALHQVIFYTSSKKEIYTQDFCQIQKEQGLMVVINFKIGRKQKWLDHVPHRDISVTIWLKRHSPSRKRLIK